MSALDGHARRVSPLRLAPEAALAFAAILLLCREALASGRIDAAMFIRLRIVAGARVLGLILWLWLCISSGRIVGRWHAAAAMLGDAACHFWARQRLSAAAAVLLLFRAAQPSVLGHDLRPRPVAQRSVDLQMPRTRGLQFNAQDLERQDLEVRTTLATAVVAVVWPWWRWCGRGGGGVAVVWRRRWWSAEASLFGDSATLASVVINRPAMERRLW